MIDPKLNELPVDPNDEIANARDRVVTPEQQAALAGQPRAGLSINDTIASNANLSVGGRGVDTSGVRAGAGAGAGMTMTTAGVAGESPMPQVVSSPRGSGTTALGANDAVPVGSTLPETTYGEPQSSSYDAESISDGDIAARAYQSWCDRGCPEGSPEVDWHRALEEHKKTRLRRSATSA